MQAEPKPRRIHRRDPGSLLQKQLQKLSGEQASVTLERERPWASITFSGTRYSFTVRCADKQAPDTLPQLARTLPEYEFALPGYFVADILVTEQSAAQLRIEVLSIIDPVQSPRTGEA